MDARVSRADWMYPGASWVWPAVAVVAVAVTLVPTVGAGPVAAMGSTGACWVWSSKKLNLVERKTREHSTHTSVRDTGSGFHNVK
jgi:ABC-type phosphate transport system auxiliary subunit